MNYKKTSKRRGRKTTWWKSRGATCGNGPGQPVPEGTAAAPADTVPAPASAGPAPAKVDAAPACAGPAPASAGPALSSAGPAPASAGPALSSAGPALASAGPAPASTGLDQTSADPAPSSPGLATASAGPVPASAGPAPSSAGPAPASAGPAPASTGPVPASAGPAPASAGPAQTRAGPAPASAGPAPASAGPAPASAGPAPASAGPAPSIPGLATASAGPAPASAGLASSSAGSTLTSAELALANLNVSPCDALFRQFRIMQAEVKQVVDESPDGILCKNLLDAYRQRYGREMNFLRFGLSNILDTLAAMWESRVCLWLTDHQGWLLISPGRVPSVAVMKAWPQLLSNPERALLPNIPYDPNMFPADCMQLGERIPPSQAARRLRPGDQLVVEVHKVYSPWRLYLTLSTTDGTPTDFEELMQQMLQYYEGPVGSQRYLGIVQNRYYCCVQQGSLYFRAVICNAVGVNAVRVLLVDDGRLVIVAYRDMRPLLRQWGRLPALAARARLAHVAPAVGLERWAPAATARLKAMVAERRLHAQVVLVDPEHNVIDVVLRIASVAVDVEVNKHLVLSKHAVPSCSPLQPSETFYNPSFEDLESGAVEYREVAPVVVVPPPREPVAPRIVELVVAPLRPLADVVLSEPEWSIYHLLSGIDPGAAEVYAQMYDRSSDDNQEE